MPYLRTYTAKQAAKLLRGNAIVNAERILPPLHPRFCAALKFRNLPLAPAHRAGAVTVQPQRVAGRAALQNTGARFSIIAQRTAETSIMREPEGDADH